MLDGCSNTVYFDSATNRVHDFCCKRHAKSAIADGKWTRSGGTGTSKCKLKGCRRDVYLDPITSLVSRTRLAARTHIYMLVSGTGGTAVDTHAVASTIRTCSLCANSCRL